MTLVGIDKIALYTPKYALHLSVLAEARNIAAEKYSQGLGQFAMSVPPPGEDIITMAANAAEMVLQNEECSKIDWVMFATESAIDFSKAAGIYVHQLLNLPAHCRTIELKQACYSATAAIQLAMPYLRENPDRKILLIASDVARYGLNTPGEPSQGAGACALLLSANPRTLAFDKSYGAVTMSAMDFWRPAYLHEALVNGKYSSKLYLEMLDTTWKQYQTTSGRHYQDHDYFLYHTPVPRLVEKAHAYLAKQNGRETTETTSNPEVAAALNYGRMVGNCYSASLYISLCSLLDNQQNLANKRIGFYSYGSGCVAEFFSGVIQKNYQQYLLSATHQQLIDKRIALNYEEYVALYQYQYPEDGSTLSVPEYQMGNYRLHTITEHKRCYDRISQQSSAVMDALPIAQGQ